MALWRPIMRATAYPRSWGWRTAWCPRSSTSTARHRPKGYRPPVPLDPLKSGGSAADRRAYVSKHAARYRQAASALAAALKAAAQTNDELAALEPLQEFVPEPVRAWPELNVNRLNEWLDRADAMSGKG